MDVWEWSGKNEKVHIVKETYNILATANYREKEEVLVKLKS